MNKLISVKNLSVRFDSAFAVKDVSFTVHEGDYLCIVGENGSGKSTLMKTILGLVKPSGGNVLFHGLKQTQIGFIPQQTVVQKDFPSSVFEVVLSGCIGKKRFLPFYTQEDRKLAMDNIKRLGADTFLYKSYRDLSGGQQQRVLLARALCATEKILLLDEPLAGLDLTIAHELYQLLDMLRKQGITIIMISHDVLSAVKYADKILHIETSPLFFGETSAYIQSPVYQKLVGGNQNV